MGIVKEIKLICVEQSDETNANKFWTGTLFDNGDVKTEWGRVGKASQSKDFPGAGESFLLKKEAEKDKKGYKKLNVISNVSEAKVVQGNSLKNIALQQIKVGNPTLSKLLTRLVDVNVHQITGNTNITYNSSTGLFQTPLGIVTPENIDEARNILVKLNPFIKKKDHSNSVVRSLLSDYLVLIPQDIGMKRLNPETFLPDTQAVTAQNDILDSLTASYQQVTTAPVKPGDVAKPVEKVFDVSIDIASPAEFSRIEKEYRNTRKDMHVCSHLKVIQVYTVRIGSMADAYGKCNVGNERELWHGTKIANLLSILKVGLKVSPPSTAAIAGKMFGNGAYFAIDSTKSLNYAYGAWHAGARSDNCFMFRALVRQGKYYVPRGSYESLPMKGYDSTWAQGGKSGVMNDEIIVYNNDQCNLTYLVEFDK